MCVWGGGEHGALFFKLFQKATRGVSSNEFPHYIHHCKDSYALYNYVAGYREQ